MPGPTMYSEFPVESNRLGFAALIVVFILGLLGYCLRTKNEKAPDFRYTVGIVNRYDEKFQVIKYLVSGKQFVLKLYGGIEAKTVFVRFRDINPSESEILFDTFPKPLFDGYGNAYEKLQPVMYDIKIQE